VNQHPRTTMDGWCGDRTLFSNGFLSPAKPPHSPKVLKLVCQGSYKLGFIQLNGLKTGKWEWCVCECWVTPAIMSGFMTSLCHILSFYVILVGTRDLRTLWSPPVSLNLVHVLAFFWNFYLFYFLFLVFSVFIIFYNKNKVFLFHFCIFLYLDASLKFGERIHTSFFFK